MPSNMWTGTALLSSVAAATVALTTDNWHLAFSMCRKYKQVCIATLSAASSAKSCTGTQKYRCSASIPVGMPHVLRVLSFES